MHSTAADPRCSPCVVAAVWVSSDHAMSWAKLNGTMGNNTLGNAPWLPRDAANAEITQAGVMVLVGGQSRQGTQDIPVNDGTQHAHRTHGSSAQPAQRSASR